MAMPEPGEWYFSGDHGHKWTTTQVVCLGRDVLANLTPSMINPDREQIIRFARLIAAAPEMLAMLKRNQFGHVVWEGGARTMSGCPECLSTGEYGHDDDCELAVLIRKAEGA